MDLAKNVFQCHRADEIGQVVQRKGPSRAKLLKFLANPPGRLIGMEARGAAITKP